MPIWENLHKFLALSCRESFTFFEPCHSGWRGHIDISHLMEQIMNHQRNECNNILGYIDDLVLWDQNAYELETQDRNSVSLLQKG